MRKTTTTTTTLPGTHRTMGDRALIDELLEALRARRGEFDQDERGFIGRLQGRRSALSKRDRRRAEVLFAREVDW
jgi:hypothetical protein